LYFLWSSLSVYLYVSVHGHPEIYRDISIRLIGKKISVAFVPWSSFSLWFSAHGLHDIYDLYRHLY
jgi:hypothetical protein